MKAFRPAYSYSDRTQLSYLLVATSAFSLFLFKYYNTRSYIIRSYLSISYYLFSVFILYISISRGPWVALVGIFLPVFLFYKDIRKELLLLNSPGLVLGAIVTIYYNQIPRIVDRITSIFQAGDPETVGRIEIYSNAISVMIEHPLTGIGWNNYSVVFEIAGSAHSIYLTIGSELGLPSLIAYLFLLIILSLYWLRIANINKISSNRMKPLYLAPVTAVLGLFVGQSFFTAILGFRAFWILFALAITAVSLAARTQILAAGHSRSC